MNTSHKPQDTEKRPGHPRQEIHQAAQTETPTRSSVMDHSTTPAPQDERNLLMVSDLAGALVHNQEALDAILALTDGDQATDRLLYASDIAKVADHLGWKPTDLVKVLLPTHEGVAL